MLMNTTPAANAIRETLLAWQIATDEQRPAARAAALAASAQHPELALAVIADEWRRADVSGFILDTAADAARHAME